MAHPVEVGRAPLPVEYLEAELSLQTLDLGAHRSLGEAYLVAGSGKSSFPSNGDKCFQFFDHSQILIVFLRKLY
ncbi:hypothetical protein D3C76_1635880 [compost metagenome]